MLCTLTLRRVATPSAQDEFTSQLRDSRPEHRTKQIVHAQRLKLFSSTSPLETQPQLETHEVCHQRSNAQHPISEQKHRNHPRKRGSHGQLALGLTDTATNSHVQQDS